MYLSIHNNNRRLLRGFLQEGDQCIDGTAGRGYDTVFLAQSVGKTGHVHAFDIQEEALASTREKLIQADACDQVTLHLASHADLDRYVTVPVKLVMFNLGYLPRGDKQLRTQKASSLEGLKKSLALLVPNGILSVLLYRDGEIGKEESQAVLDWADSLASKDYGVLKMVMTNMPNNPPIQLLIECL